MLSLKSKKIWNKFGNIQFYETFYSREGRLMLKTGGNTAVAKSGSRDVFVFEHEDPVRRANETTNYKIKTRN